MRRAGAEPSRARLSYYTRRATFRRLRERRPWSHRDGATFPQQLFVDLRRGRLARYRRCSRAVFRSAGRSFRLLGVEPITLPIEGR